LLRLHWIQLLIHFPLLVDVQGRAIAQAVSRWLPTAAARVRTRSGHVGFMVDKVALGQVFSEYFGFPCQSFHQIQHPHNHPGQVQLIGTGVQAILRLCLSNLRGCNVGIADGRDL
jgi:hypothetical protein